MNSALADLYGRRVPSIEEAAVAGTLADCAAAVRTAAAAGAELVLFTPLWDVPEHMEQLALDLIPQLDQG